MFEKLMFWKSSDYEDHPFRMIYKGDVPILQDSTNRKSKSEFKSRTSKSTRPSAASRTYHSSSSRTQYYSHQSTSEETQPTSVRRQAISPGPSKTHVQKIASPGGFPSNVIVTSRYTKWTFLPKNLFEQFRRVVNFYFLVISLVQTIIDSPVHPATALMPLCFVIFVTAVKQGYEDWFRHKNDDQVNNRIVQVVRNGMIQEIKSKDIVVGDIIRLETDEPVPTDLLLLGSSDEFARCQINTANLDGETNLKLRYCPSGLPLFKHPKEFDNLHIIVECEHPNDDMYEFNGSLLIPADKLGQMRWSRSLLDSVLSEGDENEEDGQASFSATQNQSVPSYLMKNLVRQDMTDFLCIPLSMENLALRGTRLKNTEYIYGFVIYTGKDTRLARNSEKSKSKFSSVERTVNYYLAFFIILLISLVLFCCLMHYKFDWNENGIPWYRDDHSDIPEHKNLPYILNTVASFIVLLNYIIPMSLYVTIELQKFLGSRYFVWDKDLTDDSGNEPLCNTSDLNEELGQIEYLFSDKTGTLTRNQMKFTQCSINTIRYGLRNHAREFWRLATSSQGERRLDVFSSPEVLQFFKTLALCHSVQVVPKTKPSYEMTNAGNLMSELKKLKFSLSREASDVKQHKKASLTTPQHSSAPNLALLGMEYQASSPDEKALLESCENLGIVFYGEKDDWMTIGVGHSTELYKRLMTLEFDADRKCMSVIVENEENEIWLLTKGAESSVIPKCDNGPTQVTLKQVNDYASTGLRTLAVAARKLTRQEFDDFHANLRAARRELKKRQEKVREVYMSLENHMTLLGATAVEDQLQEHVRDTLQSFSAAGIRVWMLTGDKLETGVNVAVSCGLISSSTKKYIVSHISDAKQIKRRLEKIWNEMDVSENTCFVIDGESLAWAFKECPEILQEVSMAASRVVCCRMAPLQKAQVVNMVKNSKKKPTCCAVGDGANDCAMILAANIGIGILGNEGRQAARCADFALSKFGHLRKTILVHGHWYYVRIANLANYFFYKNAVFVLPQFFFSFNTTFSPQPLFHGLFLMNYNFLFTALPIFVYGLTEQPYPADVLLKYPQLYKKNKNNYLMTPDKFLPWLAAAIWHSLVCFYTPYFAWDNFDHINDIPTFGTIVICGVMIITNTKLLIETKCWNLWYLLSFILSFVCFMVVTLAVSEFPSHIANVEDYRHVFILILSSKCFWLVLLLSSVVGILPDTTISVFKKSWKRAVLEEVQKYSLHLNAKNAN